MSSQQPTPEHDNAYDLMPAWLADTIPALYATEHTDDPLVYATFEAIS